MPRPPHFVAAVLAAGVALVSPRAGHADDFTLATLPYQPAWCAPEMDALTHDVCHVTGTPSPDGRRTLVIFLHGVIAKNTMWQWLQERGVAKAAREFHFDAIVPQAPKVGPGGAGGFAWPGAAKVSDDEDAMIATWRAARRKLERQNGHAFDEVYVVGFSSGAYFATSLALRGKLDVDGYVVLAGGAWRLPAADAKRHAPVFVGVCGKDETSAPDARELGHFLAARGWPSTIDELPVGHGVSDVHVGHALAWFRRLKERRGVAGTE